MRAWGALAMFGILAAPALAAPSEDLEFFAEEAQVITAARRAEPLRETPIAVKVIAAEEIRASGAINLWDLLRFQVGLDVLDTNQTDGLAIVSIRGFPRSTVRQLLVLVDGRSVISPSRSSVNWEELPVQLQDIDRIEIVRGPNAALYGSNAAFGVVNFITKKPSDKTAASAGFAAGSQGLLRNEESFDSSAGKFGYRLSHTRLSQGGTRVDAGETRGDFLFSNKGNFRGQWAPTGETRLDLFAGGSWDTLGQDAAYPGQNKFRQHFEMLRLTQRAGSGEAEVTAARSEVGQRKDTNVGPRDVRDYQYDGEALYRADWADERLETVSGVSYRLGVSESDQLFAGSPKQENRIWRGFFSQSARPWSWLILVGAVSLESSGTGGREPGYQLASLVRLPQGHALRFSHSLAQTIPSLFDTRANSLDSATKLRLGNPSLKPDHLYSYEAGYRGEYAQKVLVEVDFFYIEHRDLNESVFVSKVGGVTTTSFGNGNSALARGVETSIHWRLDPRSYLYANHTYEHVTDSAGTLDVSASVPAHKINFGGCGSLSHGFSLGANVGYKDAYGFSDPFFSVPAYWRLDARLAYSPAPAWELFVAGQNLTRPLHSREFERGQAIPRIYSGGLSVRF